MWEFKGILSSGAAKFTHSKSLVSFYIHPEYGSFDYIPKENCSRYPTDPVGQLMQDKGMMNVDIQGKR